MNELEASLDQMRFVFVALDDEDAATVSTFVSKRKMNAVVALNRAGKTFRAFGVTSRPLRIVVDARGQVAVVTQPEALDRKALLNISARTEANGTLNVGPAKPPASESAKTASVRSSIGVPRAPVASEYAGTGLSEVIVRRAGPDEQAQSVLHAGDGSTTLIGFSAKELIEVTLGVGDRYLRQAAELPPGRFNLTTRFGVDGGSKSQKARSCDARGRVWR